MRARVPSTLHLTLLSSFLLFIDTSSVASVATLPRSSRRDVILERLGFYLFSLQTGGSHRKFTLILLSHSRVRSRRHFFFLDGRQCRRKKRCATGLPCRSPATFQYIIRIFWWRCIAVRDFNPKLWLVQKRTILNFKLWNVCARVCTHTHAHISSLILIL